MAKDCESPNCTNKIHSSRSMCNSCQGVGGEEFAKAPRLPATQDSGGRWVSGRKRAAKAGIDDLRGILSDQKNQFATTGNAE